MQLGQVVVNLVMNACEALAGVAGDRRITIVTASRGSRVELAVRDNGPGLAEAVAARVFEPFVTTKPGGLGMGLAICRAIAEAHGGHLSAEAVAGGGLQVTLSLPRRRRTRAGGKRQPGGGGVPHARRSEAERHDVPATVHVVDDDASMRTSLARLLGGAGYGVACYATAEELLEIAGPSVTGCVLSTCACPGRAASNCRRPSPLGTAWRPSSS